MTMPYSPGRALFEGNATATDFPFSFKVWGTEQLAVTLTGPDGSSRPAVGWSARLDDNGGSVTYLHDGAPLPAGWKLAITRDMPFEQQIDLVSGTRFDAEVIETGLDRATAERQQLLEQLWCSGEKRKTVIFVTHDIREAVQLASRLLFMAPGKIVADIPVDLPRPRQQLLGEGAQMRKQLQDRLLQLFYDADGTEATDEG